MVAAVQIAKGDDLPAAAAAAAGTPIASPLQGVTDERWTRFVRELTVQPRNAVSANGCLGSFAMRPVRLRDLGIVQSAWREYGDVTKWVARFTPPVTQESFLANWLMQYNALVKSVLDHDTMSLTAPEGVSRSGRLAILHRAGPGGLATWSDGPRFRDTVNLFNRVNNIF